MSDDAPAPTEYLGDDTPPRRSGARWGLIGAAAVAVVGVAAAAAWGVAQFMGAGPAPATAAPADTLAYVGLDLDPSGGQKLEAVRTLRKFPALKDKLGIGSGDDLKRSLLEKLVKESSCKGLDYADDIEPWIGDKVGFGAVPGNDGPVPFGVLQVTDEDKARQGIATLKACDKSSGTTADVGLGFTGDYMVLAETDAVAARIVAGVDKGSLSDDPTYQKWIDAAGGDGILDVYVSPDGAKAALDSFGPLGESFVTSGDLSGAAPPAQSPRVQNALADFQGGALVARFEDQSLKVELAAGGLPTKVREGGDSGVTALPTSTAIALGVGVSDTFAQDLVDGLRRSMGSDQVDGVLSQIESETGLSLPEDLQALVGDGVSVALDSSLDLNAFFGGSSGTSPSDLPLGVRINGDPATVMPVLQKVLDATGAQAQGVVVKQGSGAVAVGVSPDYVGRLAGDGGLGGQARFTQALPGLKSGAGALYVDFDAGDWLVHTLDNAPDSEALRANVQPLSSLGVTGSADGGTLHAVLRLGTD